MPKISNCLWFDTQGEDAARHYVSIFPNSKVNDVMHYGPNTPGPEGQVMTVSFELDGVPFIALNGGPQFTFSEAISFEVLCDSQSELDHYWEKLGEGGEFGPCGWLKDKYGLSWQVVPTVLYELISDPDQDRAQRAMQAMLGMSKLDVAELQRAADGTSS